MPTDAVQIGKQQVLVPPNVPYVSVVIRGFFAVVFTFTITITYCHDVRSDSPDVYLSGIK